MQNNLGYSIWDPERGYTEWKILLVPPSHFFATLKPTLWLFQHIFGTPHAYYFRTPPPPCVFFRDHKLIFSRDPDVFCVCVDPCPLIFIFSVHSALSLRISLGIALTYWVCYHLISYFHLFLSILQSKKSHFFTSPSFWVWCWNFFTYFGEI